MPFRIDQSRAPLMVITSEGGASDAEFDRYLAEMTAMLGTLPRYAVLMDARAAARPPATQRQKQAAWMKQHHDELARYTVAMAFVIDNPIVRGALTAILWLQPMPMPHKLFARVADAERWLVERLGDEGLRVPPRAA